VNIRALVANHMATPARRGVLRILAGAGAGQVVLIAATPILTRLFTPYDFGVLTIITSLSVVVGSVAALRLDMAVPLAVHDLDAARLLRLGVTVSVLIGCSLTSLVLASGHLLDGLIASESSAWLWSFPLVGSLIACSQLLTQMAVRQRNYELIARQNIIRSAATVAVQLALAFVTGPVGLIGGLVVGQVVSLGVLRTGTKVRMTMFVREFLALRPLVRAYRRFSLWLIPASLLNTIGLQGPLLLIAFHYGAMTAGVVGLTQRLLVLPMTVAGQAFSQVYVGEISRLLRSDGSTAYLLFRRTSKSLSLLAAVVGILVLTLSPLLGPVLGHSWESVGAYARVLIISIMAQFIVWPISQTIALQKRVRMQFAWDATRAVATIGAVLIAVYSGASALECVAVLSVVSTVMYAILWVLARQSLQRLRVYKEAG
jgi:O-antigen/teichoic acid export membrane protein